MLFNIHGLMKGCYLFYPLLVFCLSACTDKKGAEIITFQLEKSDYVEKTFITGTVQAVSNTPVIPPRITGSSGMTVVRLAPDGSFVKKGDTLCVLSVPDLESAYGNAVTSVENLEADIKKAKADNKIKIALLEAQMETMDAQLKITFLDSLEMKYATEVDRKLMDLEMRRAVIEKQKIERKLASARMAAENDIMQKNVRIVQERQRKQTYADQIRSLTLVAQRDGMVIRTELPRVTIISSSGGTGSFGGPVREGSVLMLTNYPVLQFPDLSRMQISADVQESDFKRIEKGQRVNITVPSSDQLVTTGRINKKNLAPSMAMRNINPKVKFFEVIIDIDSCHSKMKPGLSANCEIILKEVKDTVYVPTLAIFERDSSRVVYVREKNEFRPVSVRTGTTGSSYTIITGGLKGDEIIALSEPPGSLIIHGSGKNNVGNDKKR